MQRHGAPPPLFLGPAGESLIRVPIHPRPYDGRPPFVPVSSVRQIRPSPITPEQTVHVKTEPTDESDNYSKYPLPPTKRLEITSSKPSEDPYRRDTFSVPTPDMFKLPAPFSEAPTPKESSSILFRHISSKDLRTDERLGEV